MAVGRDQEGRTGLHSAENARWSAGGDAVAASMRHKLRATGRVCEGANTEPPKGNFRPSENISIIGPGVQSRASRSNLAKQHLAAVVGVL